MILKGLIALACLLLSITAIADDETAEPIRIGLTAPFSGPSEPLGRSMRRGVEAQFALVNRAGGVDGRPMELVALDDGAHPEAAERQTRILIKEREVIALLGSVATPPAGPPVPRSPSTTPLRCLAPSWET